MWTGHIQQCGSGPALPLSALQDATGEVRLMGGGEGEVRVVGEGRAIVGESDVEGWEGRGK